VGFGEKPPYGFDEFVSDAEGVILPLLHSALP
jgi:hypothetical protein